MAVNEKLLRETLAVIEEQAKKPRGGEWNQQAWRCQTGMCFAGWAITLAGGVWALDINSDLDEDDEAYSYVKAEADDHDEVCVMASDGSVATTWSREDGIEVIHAQRRAQRLLGLNDVQARRLFSGDNRLFGLQRLVAEFTGQDDG